MILLNVAGGKILIKCTNRRQTELSLWEVLTKRALRIFHSWRTNPLKRDSSKIFFKNLLVNQTLNVKRKFFLIKGFYSILKMETEILKICHRKCELLSGNLNHHVTFWLDVRVGCETRSNSITTWKLLTDQRKCWNQISFRFNFSLWRAGIQKKHLKKRHKTEVRSLFFLTTEM